MDLLFFGVTAAMATLQKKAAADNTCDAGALKNSAFVFVKPHANLPATQTLVKKRLSEVGLVITAEGDIDGATIDKNKLIDQHYYAIGKYSTVQVRLLNYNC